MNRSQTSWLAWFSNALRAVKYMLGLATIRPQDPNASPRNIVHNSLGIENNMTIGKSSSTVYLRRTNTVVSSYVGRCCVDNTACLMISPDSVGEIPYASTYRAMINMSAHSAIIK